MAHIKLLQHGLVDDKLSGDVVAWCPAADFQHYFVIGCYYQHEGNREGMILLFKYENGSVTQIQSVATHAVLDLKWRERDLFVATAAGTEQWRMTTDLTATTTHLDLVQRWATDSLALYIALHQHCVLTSTEQGAVIARSLEDGSVQWQCASAHQFSAWCVASGGSVWATGGDDCALRVWDWRSDSAVMANTKHYTMGVTDIEFLPWEHTLAVGSYDESIAVWDLRSLRQPIAQHQLGGGVWRIRRVHNSLLETRDTATMDRTGMVLAVGCASNHFQLVQLTAAQSFHPLAEHRHTTLQVTPQDNTLAYGIDWCRAVPDLYVTCSFYDKIYSVWTATS